MSKNDKEKNDDGNEVTYLKCKCRQFAIQFMGKKNVTAELSSISMQKKHMLA